jgi:tetratricopeptide (TPR) repeat protein
MNKNLNKRKKAIKKPVAKKRKPIVASKKPNVAQLTRYEIVDEPMHDKSYVSLPHSVRETVDNLYDLVYTDLHKAIPPLLELSEKYPHLPQFKNYLNVAYMKSGETEKAEKMVFEIYQKHPDYLFGKSNYALICLQKGKPEKIPEIFDNKLELHLLYPGRKKFHISEYANFTAVMALYYLDTAQYEAAKTYYDSLEELNFDSDLTEMVKKRFLTEKLALLNQFVKNSESQR